MNLYQEHLERTMKAVHMETVDKIPFSWNGPAYLPKRMGLTMAEAVTDFPRSVSAAVDFCKEHPGVDSLHSPCLTTSCGKSTNKRKCRLMTTRPSSMAVMVLGKMLT